MDLITLLDQDPKRYEKELRRSRKMLFEGRCAYCQRHYNHLTLDHFIPLYLGGRHCLNNLFPACLDCNLAKSCHPPDVWYFSQPFFELEQWQTLLLYIGDPELEVLIDNAYSESIPELGGGEVETLLYDANEFGPLFDLNGNQVA